MPGYFAEHSMAVRVMSKRAVGLTYGQRALVIGALNPRLFVGTANHTSHRESPYNRLALTARLFESVFLGDRDEADRALKFTHRKHTSVVGTLQEHAGPHHPEGTPYSAHDPHLMYMTMAFTFDSAEKMHDVLVRTLTDGEREGLWQDFIRWAELFGMPREAAPSTYPLFRASFENYLASDQLFLTDEARLVGTYIAAAQAPRYPLPEPLAPVPLALGLLIQGSLPARVRELYGMRWTLAHEAAYRAATLASRTAHRRTLPLAPTLARPVLHGSSTPSFMLVARSERRNLRRGHPSMPGVATTAPQ